MALIPPQPTGQLPGSGLWNDWIEKIRTVVNHLLTSITWSIITGTPTTLAGYGITDGVSAATTLTTNRIVLGAGSHSISILGSLGTTSTVLHGNAAGAPSFGAVSLTADVSGVLPSANGGSPGAANPTGSVGLSAVNGSASTFMRSDAAPALDQTITPTMSGQWIFSSAFPAGTLNEGGVQLKSIVPMVEFWDTNAGTNEKRWQFFHNGTGTTLRAINDNGVGASNAWSITQTGLTLTGLSWGNTTDNPTFTFLGTSTPKHGSTTLLATSVALINGAAAAAGTLLNAPVAGNPTKWIPIDDNGTTRYIPAW